MNCFGPKTNQIFTQIDGIEVWRKVQGDLQHAATDEAELERPSITLSPDAISKHKAVLDPCRADARAFNAKHARWRVHDSQDEDRIVSSIRAVVLRL